MKVKPYKGLPLLMYAGKIAHRRGRSPRSVIPTCRICDDAASRSAASSVACSSNAGARCRSRTGRRDHASMRRPILPPRSAIVRADWRRDRFPPGGLRLGTRQAFLVIRMARVGRFVGHVRERTQGTRHPLPYPILDCLERFADGERKAVACGQRLSHCRTKSVSAALYSAWDSLPIPDETMFVTW